MYTFKWRFIKNVGFTNIPSLNFELSNIDLSVNFYVNYLHLTIRKSLYREATIKQHNFSENKNKDISIILDQITI